MKPVPKPAGYQWQKSENNGFNNSKPHSQERQTTNGGHQISRPEKEEPRYHAAEKISVPKIT